MSEINFTVTDCDGHILESITEMAELTEAGCVGFSQAEVPIKDTLVLHRALGQLVIEAYESGQRSLEEKNYRAAVVYFDLAAAGSANPLQGLGRRGSALSRRRARARANPALGTRPRRARWRRPRPGT